VEQVTNIVNVQAPENPYLKRIIDRVAKGVLQVLNPF